MQWLNEPHQWQHSDDAIRITVDAGTDFWRKTHYGFIRDNGHVYYQTASGDFSVEVKVTGASRDLYDQAGLMVRIERHAHWIKTGIESVHGIRYLTRW